MNVASRLPPICASSQPVKVTDEIKKGDKYVPPSLRTSEQESFDTMFPSMMNTQKKTSAINFASLFSNKVEPVAEAVAEVDDDYSGRIVVVDISSEEKERAPYIPTERDIRRNLLLHKILAPKPFSSVERYGRLIFTNDGNNDTDLENSSQISDDVSDSSSRDDENEELGAEEND
jgi:hypothetical protein